MAKGQTSQVLRIRDFRYLMTTTMLSNAAQWMQQVALNWLIYEITRSGTWLGTLNLVRGVASLLMLPLVGWLIDRLDRKKLVMLENGLLLVMTFALGLALYSGSCGVREILIFSIFAGICHIMDISLRQVLVFDIVPRDLAPNALLLIQIGWAFMRSLGPALGGFLMSWLGTGGNFFVQSGIYLGIILVFSRINLPPRIDNLDLSGDRLSMKEISEGIKFVISTPLVRAFTLFGLILPLFVIPVFVILMPIYAKDVFRAGPEAFGLLMSAVGVGGLAGGIIMTFILNRIRHMGMLQIAGFFALGLSLTAFAFSVKLNVALWLLWMAGLFEMIVLTTNRTVLQLSVPDEIRGRVTPLVNSEVVIVPIVGLAVGVLKDLLHNPVVLCASLSIAVSALAVLAYFGSPEIRRFRM